VAVAVAAPDAAAAVAAAAVAGMHILVVVVVVAVAVAAVVVVVVVVVVSAATAAPTVAAADLIERNAIDTVITIGSIDVLAVRWDVLAADVAMIVQAPCRNLSGWRCTRCVGGGRGRAWQMSFATISLLSVLLDGRHRRSVDSRSAWR